MATSVSAYSADEETFYAAAGKGWKQCTQQQQDFLKFNVTYTSEYIASAVAALQAAKDLPNLEARQGVQTRMKTILDSATVNCNSLVQDLYTIIGRCFPQNQVESLRSEAGSSYYLAATGGNWKSADTLYGMVTAFLIAYNADLIKGKMPADFPAQFASGYDDFSKASDNYSVAKDNLTKGGTAKQNANNAVYATLRPMLDDGQAIYRKNAAMRKFFSFRALIKMVAAPGKTGIRFKLQQAVSLLPVSNSSITMQPGNYTLYADKNGIAIETMPGGKYTFTITTPGTKTITQEVKITTGVVRHINLVLDTAIEEANTEPLDMPAASQANTTVESGG